MMRFLLLCVVALSFACKAKTFEKASVRNTTSYLSSPQTAVDLDPATDVVRVRLEAKPLEGSESQPYLYSYNEMNPGPTIYAKLGDTLEVELVNRMAVPTTIHWHGVHVPWEMDGVTWMRTPTQPGDSFIYRFELTQSGTFWYHPHFNTEHQVDGGLFGTLVVEDPAEPVVDEELVLVFDSANEDRPPHGSHGHGKVDTQWRINSESTKDGPIEYRVDGGRIVRVRMVNASNVGFLALRWPSLRVIGGDQGLLAQMERPDRVVLAPGDRVEALLYVTDQNFTIFTDDYSLNGGDTYKDSKPLINVVVQNPQTETASVTWPFSLARPTPDPGHTDIIYAFAGSDRTGKWFINGEQFPNITIETIPLGEIRVIEIRNLSPTEHPFHLHGMEFEVLSINGVAPAYKQIEDTITLKVRDRVRILLHANNPGDWMTHCHILPHAGDGMMTILRVQ